MALKAILFDLDDTLWRQATPPDFVRLQAQQLACLRPLFDVVLPDAGLAQLISGFWVDWAAAFRACDNDPELRELDCAALVHQFFHANGHPISAGRAREIWYALDVPVSGRVLFDDTRATLNELRRRGIQTAVVTNNPTAALANHLATFGIEVDALVCSTNVGYRKPHAAVFEEALRLLKVAPEEAIEVGDSYDVDVLGAQRAGIRGVLKLNDRDDRPEWQADFKVRRLAELLPLLDQLTLGPVPMLGLDGSTEAAANNSGHSVARVLRNV